MIVALGGAVNLALEISLDKCSRDMKKQLGISNIYLNFKRAYAFKKNNT